MKKMLLKYLIVTVIILVTFFSIDIKVSAANFKYSDFDWEELLDQNKEYWVSGCDKDDEKCHDKILKTQKGFYTRLYKILAHYQDIEHIIIDDNIIIETVFFELGPDDFRDPVEGEDNPYKIDEENATSFIGSNAGADGAVDYFKNEEDSLKTLINNMVSYNEPCYGVNNETPVTVDGKTSCSGEFIPDGDRCVVLIEKLRTTFFGSLFNSDNKNKCAELASSYPSYDLGKISQKQEVDEEGYWDFLINNNYFDSKKHLQGYFTSILKKTNKKKLSDLDSTEYEKYNDEIIKARTRIVKGIQTVLKDYEPYKSNVSMTSGSLSSYWWPIGSAETTESNGKIMATKEPESTVVTSNFGLRVDPVNGSVNASHHGIDIGGIENSTNIIAAKSGTVVSIIDDSGGNCVVGDVSCGGGYGNFVILQHTDGNYTVYAHMATGTLNVKTGDTVDQGEVLGKMGNTGKSTGPHLHFEVRVGGNDPASCQDPLKFVDATNPRKISVQSELMEWIGIMEGTGPTDGNNYVVYNDSGGVATFGHGLTIESNIDLIKSFGIDPNTLVVGSLVPKNIADEMYASRIQKEIDNIKGQLSNKSISLSENQIAALISLKYNVGNIKSFFEPYNSYGSSQNLCDWWENYALHDRNGNYLEGLKKRRIAECDLFVNGTYNMNPYS